MSTHCRSIFITKQVAGTIPAPPASLVPTIPRSFIVTVTGIVGDDTGQATWTVPEST